MCTMHMRLCICLKILSHINTLSDEAIIAISLAITVCHLFLFFYRHMFCRSGMMFVIKSRLTPSPEAMAPREGV